MSDIDDVLNSDDDIISNKNDEQINNSNEKVVVIDKQILKTLIIEWLALDDQIKVYKEFIKDKTDEKKQYEEQILNLMKVLNQEIILTDKGNITRNIKESKSPLTPELIKNTLTELIKCSSTADTYTNTILDKRTKKEIITLKRKEMTEKKKKVKK